MECDDSARKMIELLNKNEFENAAHIDYFDDPATNTKGTFMDK